MNKLDYYHRTKKEWDELYGEQMRQDREDRAFLIIHLIIFILIPITFGAVLLSGVSK